MYSLTLFEVRYKQIVTLTTFTHSLKNAQLHLSQLFFAKLYLLFYVKNLRNLLRLVTIFFRNRIDTN